MTLKRAFSKERDITRNETVIWKDLLTQIQKRSMQHGDRVLLLYQTNNSDIREVMTGDSVKSINQA